MTNSYSVRYLRWLTGKPWFWLLVLAMLLVLNVTPWWTAFPLVILVAAVMAAITGDWQGGEA